MHRLVGLRGFKALEKMVKTHAKNGGLYHYKKPVNPWRKIFIMDQQKNRHYTTSVTVSDIVMDWLLWRFTENRHGLRESVTILNCHSRARGLVSTAQTHFLWWNINVTDWTATSSLHWHGCWCGRWASNDMDADVSTDVDTNVSADVDSRRFFEIS
jgi:hypothetical protein